MKRNYLNLILLALFSIVSLNINAHDFAVINEGKIIYYNITSSTDLTLSVTYRGNSYSSYSNEYVGTITIPSSVSYNGKTYSVTSIGYEAFYDCGGLTSITIPNSVSSIGYFAFRDCSGLTSVTIPNSVTSIGNYAFYNCKGLTSVTIPNSVTEIGNWAFRGCSGLTSVTIPNSVTSIGNYAFYYCKGLTSVTIPNSVTSIEDDAFYGCSGLTSITIPNSVTSIGYYAFYGCSGLKELTMEDGEGTLSLKSTTFTNCPLESLYLGRTLSCDNSPFKNHITLTNIIIGNSVTSIGDYTFDGCSYLTSITIPNSVTSIGNYAFSGCSGLTSVTIPNSVASIGEDAFSGCSGLKELTMEDGEDILSLKSTTFTNCPLESLYLGRTLSCDNSPFKNQTTLTNIIIGNSVTSIGDYTFDGCSYLTSITIPNSVSSIGNYAFSGCSGLTSITIPNSVNIVGDYAFDGCTELKSATIGNSVSSIGNSAFKGCAKLSVVTIPESVVSIGNSAFKGCSGLRLLSIPNGVTTVGSYAFDGCSGIRTVTIGNSVELIGDYAFKGSSKFAKITIPSSVTSIGNGVFNGCSGLKELIIEDGEDILSLGTNGLGDGLFNDSPLENVYLGRDISTDNSPFNNKTSLTSLTIGYCVTTIEDATFSGCSGLKYLTIEYCDEVLSLGRNDVDEGLFYDCPLESLYLGRDLLYDISSEYGYSPFYNKGLLNSLIVGSSVTSIGCGLFEECSGLTEIYSLSSEPAVCDVFPFWGVDKAIPVYIPFGSMSAYKSATEWKEFTNFIESEFTGVEEEEISTSDIKVISGNGIEINDYYGRIRIVNLAGQVVKDVYVNGSIQLSLPKGIYIVVTENSSQKVIL